MHSIKSNLDEAIQRFGGLETISFGKNEGFYLVLVKVKDGNSAGGSDQFEVMGRKFGETNTGKGYNAYRISSRGVFETKPVQIDFASEGQWHILPV